MVEAVTDNTKRFDVRNLWSNSTTTVALLGFVIWATWAGTTERYKIREEMIREHQQLRTEMREALETHTQEIRTLDKADHEIDKKHEAEIKALTDQLDGTIDQYNETINRIRELLTRVRERQQYVLENIWTKADHDNWCRQMELTHPEFKCEPYAAGNRSKLFQEGSVNDSGAADIERALQEDPTQFWQKDEPRHPGNKK